MATRTSIPINLMSASTVSSLPDVPLSTSSPTPGSPPSSSPPLPGQGGIQFPPWPEFTDPKKYPFRAMVQLGPHILPPMRATYGPEVRPQNPEDLPSQTEDSPSPVMLHVYVDCLEEMWTFLSTVLIILHEALHCGAGTEQPQVLDLFAALCELRSIVVSAGEEDCTVVPLPFFRNISEPVTTGFCTESLAGHILARSEGARHIRWLAGAAVEGKIKLEALLQSLDASRADLFLEDKFTDLAEKISSLADRIDFGKCRALASKVLEELKVIMYTHNDLRLHWDMPRFDFLSMVPVAEGGFGKVFKHKTRPWGTVAVKISNRDGGDGEDAGKPFGVADLYSKNDRRREAVQLHAIPPHWNIMPVSTQGTENGDVVLLMPWADNGDLDTYLKKNSEANRQRLLRQVASALRHAHKCDLVHGDIHMGNVLVSAEGNALLCDFGLSKSLSQILPRRIAEDSETASAKGVIAYIAPERHEDAPRSPATDTFAFGMLCFQTYSGVPPMQGKWSQLNAQQRNLATIIALARGERPLRDEVRRPDFTDEIWDLVQRCWAQDPKDRPSMDDVYETLCDLDPTSERRTGREELIPMTIRLFPSSDTDLEAYIRNDAERNFARLTMQLLEQEGPDIFSAESRQRLTPHVGSQPSDRTVLDVFCGNVV